MADYSRSIGEVAVRLYHYTQKQYKNLVPFLETYYLITKSVADKQFSSKSFFAKPGQLSKLDVYFASLYFIPLKSYLESGKKVKPWKIYFDYCERKDGIPFVQMFLGINAHINADLSSSIRVV